MKLLPKYCESIDILSVDTVTDVIELEVLLTKRSISKTTLMSFYEDKIVDPINFLDDIFSEVIRRTKLYGVVSPIEVERTLIKPLINWEKNPEYIFFLLLSIFGVVKKIKGVDGTKYFEMITKEAIDGYLGGESQLLGFPNAKSLKSQIDAVGARMFENIGSRVPKPSDKDKGLDIVAWKAHGDGRSNQVVLLMQCGAGKNYCDKKQIPITAWREFINFSASPVLGLITPRVISSDKWIDLRDDYNLLFDRPRILRGLYKKKNYSSSIKRDIYNWCRSYIK